MGKKVMIFVGTQKGGFIFDSNAKRKKWQVSDIHFKSWNVMHMQLDPRDNRLHAATSHFVYGPTTHYSDDFGKTWTQAKQVPLLTRGSRSGRPASTVEEAFRSEGGESVKDIARGHQPFCLWPHHALFRRFRQNVDPGKTGSAFDARVEIRPAGQHCRRGVPLRGRRERQGYPGENDQGLEHQARAPE